MTLSAAGTYSRCPTVVMSTCTTKVACVKHVCALFKWTDSIQCTAVSAEVGILPACVLHVLTKHLGKWKICAEWISHVLNDDDQCVMYFSFATLAKGKKDTFLDPILTMDKS
jgi:hypothetical protein